MGSFSRDISKALELCYARDFAGCFLVRNREPSRRQGMVPERSSCFDQVIVSVSVMLWLNAEEPEPTVPVTVRG